jgi:hypothetical protein
MAAPLSNPEGREQQQPPHCADPGPACRSGQSGTPGLDDFTAASRRAVVAPNPPANFHAPRVRGSPTGQLSPNSAAPVTPADSARASPGHVGPDGEPAGSSDRPNCGASDRNSDDSA